MDSKLATAFFIGSHRCYGYELKPYCLLHSLQLEALENPVICAGSITPDHLLVAAEICSTYEVLTHYRRSLWRKLRHNLEEEVAKFDNYLFNCEQGPDICDRPDSGGGRLKAPWQQVVVTSLIRKTSIRREEAWRMPVGQALWEFHSLQEQEGERSYLYTDEDKEIERIMREQEENGETADRIQAFMEREERIQAGTWPLYEHGKPIPFSHSNLRPA